MFRNPGTPRRACCCSASRKGAEVSLVDDCVALEGSTAIRRRAFESTRSAHVFRRMADGSLTPVREPSASRDRRPGAAVPGNCHQDTGCRGRGPNFNAHKPAWSADGTELFYVPRIGEFEVVPIITRPTFEFGNPVVVPRPFTPGGPNMLPLYDRRSGWPVHRARPAGPVRSVHPPALAHPGRAELVRRARSGGARRSIGELIPTL